MFYVKTKLNENTAIMIDITDDNVFTKCPDCGNEVQVELDDYVGDEEFELYGSFVFCPECSKRRWFTQHMQHSGKHKCDYER